MTPSRRRIAARLRRVVSTPEGIELRGRHLGQLSGDGLEIGALHNPAPLPAAARVRYVDQFDVDELRRRNPEVPAEHVVRPDIISDGHHLSGIADGSCDFVVASHVLEHLHNPLAGLLEWRRVLKEKGRLVCVVPDGRFTFDRGRPLTSLEHLIWDFVNEGSELKALSDLFHIAECNLNMHESLDRDGSIDLAKRIFDETYDTHFHVWSYESFCDHLDELTGKCGLPFRVAAADSDGRSEMVVTLEAGPGRFKVPPGRVVRAAR